ncbi:MAG: sugar porter family MFS transporter [Rhodospirillaceae bacterium]|nr:sugar porter family MFS transporter [Rhodospirillaceae bacterium]
MNSRFIIAISCIATIGGFLFGFDSGVINGTVDGLQIAFQSDSVGTGFNVASMLLGCAAGAFFAGRLADVIGRRNLLIVASIFFLVSAWGSGIASSSAEFVFFRVLGGMAVGAASVIAPAYIGEVAPAHYRGRLITVQQIAIITGLFSAFVSNYLLARFAGASTAELWLGFEAWRWMFWIEMAPAVLFFLGLLLIPESPRYLVIRGRTETAHAVLTRLYGQERGEEKLTEIDESLAEDHHRPRFSDLIDSTTGRVRKLVWVGIGLATFQQLVGINVVFYYGAVLWQSVGFSESDALLINVISGAVSIGACLITVSLIDRIGRKPLLWIGSVGMAFTLSAMALAFASATLDEQGALQLSDTMGTVALVAANLYVFFFNASWGPVMWVMLGEMFPNQIRGSGLAISGLAQWGSNFGITMTFPILLVSIGLMGAYSLYALAAVVSVYFVIRHVHETRGLELEEMQG